MSDQRQWPRKLQEAKPEKEAPPTEGVSLENLHLDLSHNIYARDENEPLFVWGTNWLRHIDYSTIETIQSDLNLEKSSRIESLNFRSYAERDFCLPRNSPVFRMDCYPRGKVPDVLLNGTER